VCRNAVVFNCGFYVVNIYINCAVCGNVKIA
jgi:hypothetical protein